MSDNDDYRINDSPKVTKRKKHSKKVDVKEDEVREKLEDFSEGQIPVKRKAGRPKETKNIVVDLLPIIEPEIVKREVAVAKIV